MVDNKKPKRAIAELEALNFQIRGALETGRNTYWAIVKFESDDSFNKGYAWHLHVTFEGNPDISQDKFLTTVGLLSEDGPEHLLYKGSKFELVCFNMKTIIAKGVIVDLK